MNPPAHRVSSWEPALGHPFVDHDGHRRTRDIVRIEQPAAPKRDIHRLQISRTHRVPQRTLIPSLLRRRTRFETDSIRAELIATERQLAGKRRRRHARNLAHGIQSLREESPISIVVIEAMASRLHLHGQHMRSVETRRDRKDPLDTSQQQSRAHQQHQRQRYFCHNESPPCILLTAHCTPRILPQSDMKILAVRMHGRNQTDHNPYQRSDAERESKHSSIDANRVHARQLPWTQRNQRADSELRHQHPQRSAQRSQ